MKFWDASAVIPLLTDEPTSETARRLRRNDPELMVWWATEVECASALARLERHGRVPTTTAVASWERLEDLVGRWIEVDPHPAVRRNARRLLRTHDLRGGDALQLAAALQGCEGDPASLGFVCCDERLNEAASREGFVIIDPGTV